jgi:hypothetical protein
MNAPKTLAVMLLGVALGGVAMAQPDAPPPMAGDVQGSPDDVSPDAPSVDYFYQPLSAYGDWSYREGYGEVWAPRVEAGWRPYTTGHWVYTDDGWAWVADEAWGWAPFHYGRWLYDDAAGWAWVPGTQWAPAWVAWRNGGGYVGWAALPPTVGFEAGVGVQWNGVDIGVAIAPTHYCFVQENAILAPRVVTVLAPSTQNVTIINRTTNITNITVVNNRVVNTGVPVAHVEQVIGHPVQRLRIEASTSASARGRVNGAAVSFYQPAAVTRAARVNHAEFGGALKTQVAVQSKSKFVGKQVVQRQPAGKPVPPPPAGATRPLHGTAAPAGGVEEVQRRHNDEKQQLVTQQAKERAELTQKQQAEVKAKGQSADLAKQHADQAKALQSQHQNQQQKMDTRHKQEVDAAQKNNKEKRPPA